MTSHDPMLERLAGLRVDVPESVRQRQLGEILAAVRTAPPVRAPKNFGRRRRWATAVASLAMVVAPVGTAVAAEDSLPGEALYPVKQVSERLRSVFDEDLPATHRVEELEALLERHAAASLVAEAERRAGEAIAGLDDPGELAGRLEQVRIRIRQQQNREETGPGSDGDQDRDPGDGGQGSQAPAPDDGSTGGGEGPGSEGDPQRDQDQNQDGMDGSGSGGTGSGGSGSVGSESGGSGTGGSGGEGQGTGTPGGAVDSGGGRRTGAGDGSGNASGGGSGGGGSGTGS